MKLLWQMSGDAKKYRLIYFWAILASLGASLTELAAPAFIRKTTALMEAGLNAETLSVIYRLALCLLAVYFCRVFFLFGKGYLAHKAAWNLVCALRVRVYEKLQNCSLRYFSDKQTGDIMSRVVNDTGCFELLYAHIIPDLITNGVVVLGVAAVLFGINASLALLTLVPIIFIVGAGFLFSKYSRPKFRLAQSALGGLNSKLQDNFSGIGEIQSFNQQERELHGVREIASVHVGALLSALRMSAFFHPAVSFFSAAGTVALIAFGGYLALHQGLKVSDIVAFLLYLSLFYAPIAGLSQIIENIQQALAGAERVAQVMEAPNDIFDCAQPYALTDCAGEITFENVGFYYDRQQGDVLKNINLKIKAGETIALVGPTGVGKTTFSMLIPRFYDPTDGRVLLDGRDVKTIALKSLRENIAPVRQDTFLFNGTVAENIAYPKPGAGKDEIIAAAKAAFIHDDIIAMPQGYDTQIGERGVRLSGGQKQRLAIARAVLCKAPVIILDEATASVDTKTEYKIQEALSGLFKTKTVIAIAHRLSTIQNADRIIVLKDGEIIQEGVHEELMRQGDSLYYELHSVS